MPGRLYSRPALIDAGMHPRVLSSPAIVAPLPGYCARADAPVPLIAVAQVLQNEGSCSFNGLDPTARLRMSENDKERSDSSANTMRLQVVSIIMKAWQAPTWKAFFLFRASLASSSSPLLSASSARFSHSSYKQMSDLLSGCLSLAD